jgi:hypothetical protein
VIGLSVFQCEADPQITQITQIDKVRISNKVYRAPMSFQRMPRTNEFIGKEMRAYLETVDSNASSALHFCGS